MEIVDGYQLQELQLLVVLYLQIALLQQEQQLLNAKPGDQLVSRMVLLACRNQLAHHIQHKQPAEMLVLMVHASG